MTLSSHSSKVSLRVPILSDVEQWFQFQLDPTASEMAAFTSEDPSDRSYVSAWETRLDNPEIRMRTILRSGVGAKHLVVCGSVGSFPMSDRREITYWLGRSHWGKGIASRALALYLQEESERPLWALVACHNIGSIRVLEKCGFRKVGEESGFSAYLKKQVEEYVYRLD